MPLLTGRSVSLARWNSHYMIRSRILVTPGRTRSPPVTLLQITGHRTGSLLTTKGPRLLMPRTHQSSGDTPYMVYDEGGIGGYECRWISFAHDDFTIWAKGFLLLYGSQRTSRLIPGSRVKPPRVDNIVGWRNYASAQPSGNFSPPTSFSFSANAANTYYNFVLSDPTNIKLTNYLTGSVLTYFTNSFLQTSHAPVFNTQTDQALASATGATQASLWSERGWNRVCECASVSWHVFARSAFKDSPMESYDSRCNKSELSKIAGYWPIHSERRNCSERRRVSRQSAVLLQRLNWLTYKGPSGPSVANPTGRNIPSSGPGLGNADYDMWLLTRGALVADRDSIRFGLTSTFLKDSVNGDRRKYPQVFWVLAWDTTNQRWNYVGHNGSATPIDSIATFRSRRDSSRNA